MVDDLRPGVLDQGIVPALEWLTSQFAQRSGIETHFDANRDTPLDAGVSIGIYRVCQEALSNVVKHSGATTVDVHLFAAADQIHLEVTDNGSGLILSEDTKPAFGLTKMHERARNLQGSLDISSSPARGTTVLLSLPLPSDVRIGVSA
jgi:signal transduction histidine kinase